MPLSDKEARLIEMAEAWRARAIGAEATCYKLKQALLDLDIRQQMYRQVRVVDAKAVER
jgi:hypothetical protein